MANPNKKLFTEEEVKQLMSIRDALERVFGDAEPESEKPDIDPYKLHLC